MRGAGARRSMVALQKGGGGSPGGGECGRHVLPARHGGLDACLSRAEHSRAHGGRGSVEVGAGEGREAHRAILGRVPSGRRTDTHQPGPSCAIPAHGLVAQRTIDPVPCRKEGQTLQNRLHALARLLLDLLHCSVGTVAAEIAVPPLMTAGAERIGSNDAAGPSVPTRFRIRSMRWPAFDCVCARRVSNACSPIRADACRNLK